MSTGLELRPDGDGVLVPIQVVPRARRSELQGLVAGRLKLRVAAPPAGGAANAACLELLAELLGVRRSAVTLVRGGAGRLKLVRVAGLTLAQVALRLGAAPGPSSPAQ
jgi:uncharacterized protein (TIGR00251 family)